MNFLIKKTELMRQTNNNKKALDKVPCDNKRFATLGAK